MTDIFKSIIFLKYNFCNDFLFVTGQDIYENNFFQHFAFEGLRVHLGNLHTIVIVLVSEVNVKADKIWGRQTCVSQ